MEQKGVLVPIGELTVYLDGLTVTGQEELAPLTNGNAANGTSERSIYMLGVGDGKTAIFNDKEEAQRESQKCRYVFTGKYEYTITLYNLALTNSYCLVSVSKYTLVHNICRLTLVSPILYRSPTEWRHLP